MVRLLSLYNHMESTPIINTNLLLYAYIHILLVLFLWITLTNTGARLSDKLLVLEFISQRVLLGKTKLRQ